MGAIKTFEYTPDEWDVSLIARGISHPARVKIIKQLKEGHMYTNIDFSVMLRMTASSVKDHLDKLHEAELINVSYRYHYYAISLNRKRVERLEQLMQMEF